MRDRAHAGGEGLAFFGASVVLHLVLVLALGREEEHVPVAVPELSTEVSVHVLAFVPESGARALHREPVAAAARVPAMRARMRAALDAPAEASAAAPASAEAPEVPPTTTPTSAAAASVSSGSVGGALEGDGGAATASGTGARGHGAGDDASAVRAFVARVRARVLAMRRYPIAAMERGLEGDVIVTLEITRGGEVKILAIDAASAPSMLVTSATNAIRDAGAFPIPPDVTRDVVRARLTIRFDLDDAQ